MLNVTETTVRLGLEHPIRVCQITDLHLLHADARDGVYENEHAGARKRYFPDSHAVEAALADFLAEEKPDLLLLTGDIIDFPSEENLDALHRLILGAGCPYLYIPGNHDWSYPRGYHSDEHVQTYLPRFFDLTGGTPDFQIREIGGIMFIGVDDSRHDSVTEAQVQKLERAFADSRARGIPAVVCMHIPIHSAALEPEAKRVWSFPVVVGDERADDATRAFRTLCGKEASAVIAGHVHFAHDAPLDDSACVQYIAALSAVGNVRRFVFI